MVSINYIIGAHQGEMDVYVTNYSSKSKCKVGTITNTTPQIKFGSISIALSRDDSDGLSPIILSGGHYFGIYVVDSSTESPSEAPPLSIEGSVYYSLTYNQNQSN